MESLACFACPAIFAANRVETTPDASGGVCLAEEYEARFSESRAASEQYEVETVTTGKQRLLDLALEDD